MEKPLDLSVVVPTIGSRATLRSCIESVAACRPRAAELLVIDQSPDGTAAALLDELRPEGARALRSEVRSIGAALEIGLEAAAHDHVLVTHDDCHVDPDWVKVAWELLGEDPDAIFTGRVRPGGEDPERVPSTRDDTDPVDYTGQRRFNVLFPNNMLVPASAVLDLGGFDARIPFAEDNDFCYRWLMAGGRLRYEPRLTVWHVDWRSPEELEQLYVNYARGQGYFYAKHLRNRDLKVLPFLLAELAAGSRSLLGRMVRGRGRPRWSDWRQGVWRGLPKGLIQGWRELR